VHIVSDATPGHWPVRQIVAELCKRRSTEPTVAYVECHDQSLVGAQTLAFRLMGTDMYHFMSRLSSSTPRIEFGIAMLKVVRLLTSALGGEGYLSFMGNEFGHPDWIDFPREGNNFSFEKARRRWDLVDDPLLRFRWLNDFDRGVFLFFKKMRTIAITIVTRRVVITKQLMPLPKRIRLLLILSILISLLGACGICYEFVTNFSSTPLLPGLISDIDQVCE